MMKTFGQRLGSCIGPGQSRRSFSKQLGVSDTMLRNYLDDRAAPRDKTLPRLAQKAGVHVKWLATGEGPRDIQPEAALSLARTKEEHVGQSLRRGEVLPEAADDAIVLPRLTIEGSAGSGLIPSREEIEDYLSVSRRYLREVGINPLYAHVLRLSGHSMFPTLQDKDLVIVDTSQTTVRDEEIYALAYGEAVLIKRLHPQWDGGMKIISDNKGGHYADALVPAAQRSELRIVGRVGGYLRYI